jgi:hypothetical protein
VSEGPEKPNVCARCGEYVGPESVPHREPMMVVGPWLVVVEPDPPGVVRHTTRDGKGVVGRLRERAKRSEGR